ncbi:MAG: N-acetylmuramoyl-L-alanine amidase [Bacteroidota bacterium]
MKNSIFLVVIASLVLFSSFNTGNVWQYRVRKVVVDAGHGGKDPGTHGAVAKEKDIALSIALKLGGLIEENLDDVEVIYTRDDDTFIELDERANIANKNGADLFISIHANYIPAPRTHGTETYVMGLHKEQDNLEAALRENSVILLEEDYEEAYEDFDGQSPESYILFSLYQNAYLENSLLLANKIERQMKDRVKRRSRGVKQAGFIVLYKSTMPSVLVETGFLSNPEEERYLNDDLGQTYIASGIFRAVREYKADVESTN